MPLPEKMSENELLEAIEQDPSNEWLKVVLERKQRLINRTLLSRELAKDNLHYT